MLLRPRWRKILADFWDNKARSFLVIASIFIGVFAVGMILTSKTILSNSLLEVYEQAAPANITVQTSPFGQSLVDHIERVNGVESVTARKTIAVRGRVDETTQWENLNINIVQDIDTVPYKKISTDRRQISTSQK